MSTGYMNTSSNIPMSQTTAPLNNNNNNNNNFNTSNSNLNNSNTTSIDQTSVPMTNIAPNTTYNAAVPPHSSSSSSIAVSSSETMHVTPTITSMSTNAPTAHSYTPTTTNTSLFHQAKRAFMGVRPEFDNDYVSLRHHHEEMSNVLTRLQSHFGRYVDLSKATYQEGNTIARDMTSLLNDPQATYTNTVSTVSDVHYEIGASSSNMIAESLLSPDVRVRIDDAINRCRDLSRRMKEHEECKAEVDYYGRKVDKLRNEKNGLAPGVQKPKLDDRLDRNLQKYERMHQHFADNHAKMLHDLADLWLNRAQILGPLLANFISVEREVARRHFDMLSVIDIEQLKNIPAAPISAYPVHCTSPANYHMLKKNTLSTEDLLPGSTEHSVSEGNHLDSHPIGSAYSTPTKDSENSTMENAQTEARVPINQQPPGAAEVANTKPIAPPRPPRPVHNLTLVPGAIDMRQPGITDESPLTPPHEVPPYKAEHPITMDNGRTLPTDQAVVKQLEEMDIQRNLPRSADPMHDAAQPLLKSELHQDDQQYVPNDLSKKTSSYSSVHDPKVQINEPDQPIRTLSDLIRRNSRSNASSGLQKEGVTYNDQGEKGEEIHLSSESRDERQERQAAVFPQTQSQPRSNIIEYI